MVIVKIWGGLGNQMFQYALGRRIALDNNLPLKLDITSGFRNDFYNRRYSLHHFNIIEDIASSEELDRMRRSRSLLFRVGNRFRPYYKHYVVRENKLFKFDPKIIRSYKDVYLEGYWQTQKYFEAIQNLIRQEFIVKDPPEGFNAEVANEIINVDSVCVHVRQLHGMSRNLADQRGVTFHGTNSLEYYERGIHFLATRLKDVRFFVFADDPSWGRTNLTKLPYSFCFVTHNREDRDYEDLRLMSLCKHHVISNSTFSWWAAWLSSSSPDKTVVAPRKWFNDPQYQSNDIIPELWVTM
jgi:Glycosyl transferase family 11